MRWRRSLSAASGGDRVTPISGIPGLAAAPSTDYSIAMVKKKSKKPKESSKAKRSTKRKPARRPRKKSPTSSALETFDFFKGLDHSTWVISFGADKEDLKTSQWYFRPKGSRSAEGRDIHGPYSTKTAAIEAAELYLKGTPTDAESRRDVLSAIFGQE